jgi:hypothetical protein
MMGSCEQDNEMFDRSLGVCRRVGWQVDANVWEKHSVSIFREKISPKHQHLPANPHCIKTQDFDNNIKIIVVKTSNLRIMEHRFP